MNDILWASKQLKPNLNISTIYSKCTLKCLWNFFLREENEIGKRKGDQSLIKQGLFPPTVYLSSAEAKDVESIFGVTWFLLR